jgi:predicted acylesterase/phospholipase RssA
MQQKTPAWNSFLLFIKKKLQQLAILLELGWVFFPGILFIVLSAIVFTRLLQGKDVIALSLESSFRGYFFLTGLLFWAGVTWYTGRLIAYNHDTLFQKASNALYHAPRVMGFLCFTVLIYAFLVLPQNDTADWLIALVLITDLVAYFIFHWIFERIKDRQEEKKLDRYRNITLLILAVLFLFAGYFNTATVYLVCLPMMQLGFLFLVIIRRKITETAISTKNKDGNTSEAKPDNYLYKALNWILTDDQGDRSMERSQLILKGEWKIFKWFNLGTILALSIYFLAIFNLPFSRFLSPFPFALLAFGILLGFGNLVALFSTKLKINFHFIFFMLVVLVGFITEPHNVRIRKIPPDQGQVFNKREDLHTYFNKWTAVRKEEIADSLQEFYPVFFSLADGGASRSGYWTASVLSQIEDKTKGRFSRHLFCLSGASGGSVGNAAFYASLYDKNTNGNVQSHLANCQSYLSNDFLSFTLARMLGPDFFKPLFPFDFIYDRAAALEWSLESVPKNSMMGQLMATPLSRFLIPDQQQHRQLPVLCINTTSMQDGRPGVVSSIKLENSIFGRRLDVLDSLRTGEDVNLSSMVILGARFPYISPAGRIRNNYFVDGGYFDNSGAGVIHEMIIELQRMINDSLQKNPGHYLGKLRFYVVHTTNSPLEEASVKKVHPLINDLAAPVKTLVGSYSNQTYVNNLRLFKYLLQINKGDTTYIPFNLYQEAEKDLYPMNWVISDSTRAKMDIRLKGYTKIERFIDAINTYKPEDLKSLFKD